MADGVKTELGYLARQPLMYGGVGGDGDFLRAGDRIPVPLERIFIPVPLAMPQRNACPLFAAASRRLQSESVSPWNGFIAGTCHCPLPLLPSVDERPFSQGTSECRGIHHDTLTTTTTWAKSSDPVHPLVDLGITTGSPMATLEG